MCGAAVLMEHDSKNMIGHLCAGISFPQFTKCLFYKKLILLTNDVFSCILYINVFFGGLQ